MLFNMFDDDEQGYGWRVTASLPFIVNCGQHLFLPCRLMVGVICCSLTLSGFLHRVVLFQTTLMPIVLITCFVHSQRTNKQLWLSGWRLAAAGQAIVGNVRKTGRWDNPTPDLN